MNNPVPKLHFNPSFHAQHAPVGAFTSFTCGLAGKRGGLAAQLGRPANHDLYVGIKDGPVHSAATPQCFPFFAGADALADPAANFLAGGANPDPNRKLDLIPFPPTQWHRHYGLASDTFTAEGGRLRFSILTPYDPIPDPTTAPLSDLRAALLPAVRAEITLDNTTGKNTQTLFFALAFDLPGIRQLTSSIGPHRAGFALRRELGFLAESDSTTPPTPILRWSPTVALSDPDNPVHLLGTTPGVYLEVPPGQSRTLRIALGSYLAGTVTTGLDMSYLYTRCYTSLEDVLSSALDTFPAALKRTQELDQSLLASGLSPDRQFLIAHATRSYFGSTQLLDHAGKPFWVVNEGEYCMINTLDLSIDHVFFELKHNPWVVKNLLVSFLTHYAYHDTVGLPGEPKSRPGGISFAHDMGAHNQFSPPGTSSYELANLDALCFSHMTAEQLCNYLLLAATYLSHTKDTAYATENQHVFLACQQSLLNRCGDAGIILYDSSRCGPRGSEITTYDSLDHSLAQTRNNLYMATKAWAAFLALGKLQNQSPATHPNAPWLTAAHAAAKTISAQLLPDGTLPAVFEPQSPGHASRILPAIEGLLYPLVWGDRQAIHTQYPDLLAKLKTHTLACLSDPQRRNHFPDGGLRLSSTSDNSWLSKIFLFQYITESLGWTPPDPRADAAHVQWTTAGESGYWAMSDQIVSGTAKASKYYPRCVTNTLWL